jgi:hypothetical protein
MRRQYPVVFVSASLRPEDAKLVEWFCKIMESLEFDVKLGDAPEPGSVTDKERREIREAEGFVAIMTKRDKLEERDAWKTADWIQHEIGAAWDAGKPLMVFRDRRVEAGGMIPHETTYVEFEPEALHKAVPLIVRGLVALQRKLVPIVATREDMGLIAAIAGELNGLARSLTKFDKEFNWPGLKSCNYALTTGRLHVFPPTLKDAFEEVQVAVGELYEANEAASKFELRWTFGRKESNDARNQREAKLAKAIEELQDVQRSALPVVARSALLFYETAFPDEAFSIELLRRMAELPPKLPK